jgi:hypothetical protein
LWPQITRNPGNNLPEPWQPPEHNDKNKHSNNSGRDGQSLGK